MQGISFDATLLVYVATFFYALGFIFQNPILLRSLVLIGTALYIFYYYFQDPTLWDAIYGSALIAAANVFGFANVLMDRMQLFTKREHRGLFGTFNKLIGKGGMLPGNFRQLMKYAEFNTADETSTLIQVDIIPNHLYFVMDGSVLVEKDGQRFAVEPEIFLGEVAMIMNAAASASVHVNKGTTYVRWPVVALKAQLEKNVEFSRTFDVLLSRDMARKVAKSARNSASGESVSTLGPLEVSLDTVTSDVKPETVIGLRHDLTL